MITQKGKINEVARALQKVQELFDTEAIDLAVTAIAAMDNWIPISEAPRDGRKLLMYNSEYGGQQFVDWVAFDGTLGKHVDVHNVTHFQYLPEPPKTQEQKQ